MRVVFLIAKEAAPDSRIVKQARTLMNNGFQVQVVAWDRLHRQPAQETFMAIDTVHIQGIKSPPRQGFKQMLKLPVYWFQAVRQVHRFKPAVVHCCDLDTLPAGLIAKAILGARVVYDAREDYSGTLGARFPHLFRKLVRFAEGVLARWADGVITASRWVADGLRGRGVRKVTAIPNCAPLEDFAAIDDQKILDLRQKLGAGPTELVVAYIGGLYPARVLRPLVDAASHLPDVKIWIVGGGQQEQGLREVSTNYPNVVLTGHVPLEDVPVYTSAADITYYGVKDAPYNSPNALYNSIAASRPILAVDSGDLGWVIRKYGCGLFLPEFTTEAIVEVIRSIKSSPQTLRSLTAGAKNAANDLNWQRCEETLLGVYADVLPESGLREDT